MSPAPARRRHASGQRGPAQPKDVGAVRRAQVITTYGVGSMVAVDGMSFLVSGLDSWSVVGERPINEFRLSQILGIRHFYLPPAPSEDEVQRGTADGIHVTRFPMLYSCPTCEKIDFFSRFNPKPGTAECGACDNRLVPSRFVLACEKGHLEEFPYWKWVHRGLKDDVAASGYCGGELTFRAEGSTASLRAITVSCTCGVPGVSMEGAFRTSSLKELGIGCGGRRPWLRGAGEEPCTARPRTLQRGAASVWSPVVRSAISIPPWGQGVNALVERDARNLLEPGEDYIRQYLANNPHILAGTRYTADDVLAVRQQVREADGEATDGEAPSVRFSSLRAEEYKRLREGNAEDPDDLLQSFVCEPPARGVRMPEASGIAQVMLVKRLREVRALHSFTRIAAPADQDDDSRFAPLTVDEAIDWLPAIEVSGEGVFLRLDSAKLRRWEGQQGAKDRADRVRRHHQALLDERSAEIAAAPSAEGTGASGVPPRPFLSTISPRYLLLHTLAHALINEWSLDGGYPAAALRERLYVASDMCGILIYTATSDSAGSLGGVVAQGSPNRLSETLATALERARWCSNDPLCLESEASGAESLNLAACHACALLPETSCEHFNTILDRGLLIGTDDVAPYFA